jgi:hypothetical protein
MGLESQGQSKERRQPARTRWQVLCMLRALILAECLHYGSPPAAHKVSDEEYNPLLNFTKELGYIANLLPRDTEIVAVSSTVYRGEKGVNVSIVDNSAEKLKLATVLNPDDISRRKR